MEDQATRFKILINALKTNQLKLSNSIGVPYSQTNQIWNGKGDFSRGYLQKLIIRHPTISLTWLLSGAGSMFIAPVSESDITVLQEGAAIYKKSISSVPNISIDNDDMLRNQLAENLKTLVSRWGMKKNEFFPILIPDVSKQTVTNYFNGSSQVPLFALVRLEKITGVGLAEWLTRSIGSGELPPEPLESGGGDSNQIELIKKELRSLLNRLGG